MPLVKGIKEGVARLTLHWTTTNLEDEKNALEEAENAKIVLKKAKSAQNFYKKIASMKRTQWKAFAATMIQAKWRSKKQLENYKKEKLARNMEVGFKVTIDCWSYKLIFS